MRTRLGLGPGEQSIIRNLLTNSAEFCASPGDFYLPARALRSCSGQEAQVVELDADVEAWIDGKSAQWTVVFLRGPAGAGKTTFLNRLLSSRPGADTYRIAWPDFSATAIVLRPQDVSAHGATAPFVCLIDDFDRSMALTPRESGGARHEIDRLSAEIPRLVGAEVRLLLIVGTYADVCNDLPDAPVWDLLSLNGQPYSAIQAPQMSVAPPDRRELFLKKHLAAFGMCEPMPPKSLLQSPLFDLSARPSFAAWIAGLHAAGFLEQTNIVRATDVLAAVPRLVAHYLGATCNSLARQMNENYVARVLEEVALINETNAGAASSLQFHEHCHRNGLAHLIDGTPEPGGAAVTWMDLSPHLLYVDGEANRLVSFHPSLQEALLARRLLRAVRRMHDESFAYGEQRWTSTRALAHWCSIASRLRMTDQIVAALASEMTWHDTLDPRVAQYVTLQWQQMLSRLLPTLLSTEPLSAGSGDEPGVQGIDRIAAGVAMLIIAALCMRETGIQCDMTWPSRAAVSGWLSQITAQRDDNLRRFASRHICGLELSGQDLSGLDLTGAVFRGATLRGAVLANCILRDADFYACDFHFGDLSGADLRGVNFEECSLIEANLTGACASGARFLCTNLRNANLSGALLDGCDLQKVGSADTCLEAAPK
jgi:hypothetical protein